MSAKPGTPAKKRSKIKAKKQEPIRIGDKVIRLSRRATVTITDVDNPDDPALK